jgi:hypothetical protein
MTAARGLTNHEICESIERVHKKLLRMRFTTAESTRGAIVLTAYWSGEFTREEAWADADAIMAKLPNRGAIECPENLS